MYPGVHDGEGPADPSQLGNVPYPVGSCGELRVQLAPCLFRDLLRASSISARGKHQTVEQDLLQSGPKDGESRCVEIKFTENEGRLKLPLQILGAAGVFVVMRVLHARCRQTALEPDEITQ